MLLTLSYNLHSNSTLKFTRRSMLSSSTTADILNCIFLNLIAVDCQTPAIDLEVLRTQTDKS